MKHPKNYVGFANDHSSSMSGLVTAAIRDYNNNIAAITGAATRNTLDTIVSVVGFSGSVERQIVNSNPHVLKPMASWKAGGMTALYDAVGELINLFKSMPDYSNPNVSFLVLATTDGDENSSRSWSQSSLAREIKALQATGRWTFVLRVPEGQKHRVSGLGIPEGNIQEWNTTAAGMEKSTTATTAAFDNFYATRAAGKTSSNVFYADATAVDTSKLLDVSSKVSLYVVEGWENAHQIRDFVLRRRTRYLKGSAFYQLTKTEARVGPNKMLAVRDRTTGAIFAGKEARTMLGLSSVDNIRLHPGDHGNYDLFIQSESVNRKLVAGTGVLYWEELGVPFTQEEIDRFNGNAPVVAKPAVVQLPAVAPTNKPTPSPLKAGNANRPVSHVTPPQPVAAPAPAHGIAKPQPIIPSDGGRVRYHTPSASAMFYPNREVARYHAEQNGRKQYDAGPSAPKGRRFYTA